MPHPEILHTWWMPVNAPRGISTCKVAFACQCESSPTGTLGRQTRSNLTHTLQIARVVRGYAFVRLSLRAAQRAAKQSHRHIGDRARGDCARTVHGFSFVRPRVIARPLPAVIASRPEGGEAISPSHRKLRAVHGYPFVRLSLRAAQRAAKQSHRHKGRSVATLASR